MQACKVWNFDEEDVISKVDVKCSKSLKNEEKRVKCYKCKLNFHPDDFVFMKDPKYVGFRKINSFIAKACALCREERRTSDKIRNQIAMKKWIEKCENKN